ncbi:hypothetical protein [Herbaspirillum rubrisubalbicans]|uniref:hypothetical protein n=1 Tax=Herbaspirillum rubrisubalbicans TaxID=80842 RepID=UPI0012F6FAE9|nr:hypothetical protein [Herbaspirillum rubrisubalbicans]
MTINKNLAKRLREVFAEAASEVERKSFSQEPQYTAAFFGKLAKKKIIDPVTNQSVQFETSVSDDRGRNTAEKNTGIDIGFVLRWDDGAGSVFEKAILMQAKNRLGKLSGSAKTDLIQKCQLMAKITRSYVVLDCPFDGSIPQICQSDSSTYWRQPPISLADYLVDIVAECKDGDTTAQVLEIAQRADRIVKATIFGPKPGLNFKPPKKKNKSI